MDARILTTDELLEQTAIDVQEAGDMSDEDAFAIESEGDPKESKQAGLRADELKEYLKRLDPEDFGRFNP
jgi:hypothetical protein